MADAIILQFQSRAVREMLKNMERDGEEPFTGKWTYEPAFGTITPPGYETLSVDMMSLQLYVPFNGKWNYEKAALVDGWVIVPHDTDELLELFKKRLAVHKTIVKEHRREIYNRTRQLLPAGPVNPLRGKSRSYDNMPKYEQLIMHSMVVSFSLGPITIS